MLQQIYTFDFCMTGTTLYRQTGAAILLLLLLFTTTVQLTHSHTIKQTAAVQLKKQTPQPDQQQITVPGADTKCFIHEYQLTKDADFSCNHFQIAAVIINKESASSYNSQILSTTCSYFENRGPPASYNPAL
jgi:hypothetical protein